MMKKQAIAALLCAGMLAGMLSGCNSNGDKKTATTSDVLIPEVTTSDTYPIETDAKLTYWVGLSSNVAAYAQSLNETDLAKWLQEETGVGIEFIHPAAGQTQEKFNLMIASRDMTDIVESGWSSYTGGPDKAIKDKIIYPLNEILDKVSPNYKKFLDEHTNVAAELQTMNGDFYMYPFVTLEKKLLTANGFMVRKDLLDKAGLDVPETLDEWETVLAAFKDMGIKTPIMLGLKNSTIDGSHMMMGGFGIQSGWYVEDGKVKYGQYEEAFADYVKMLAKWYQNGWLDSGFTDEDSKRTASMVISGEVGAVCGWNGSAFGSWIPSMATSLPEAELTPAPYVAQNKGETPFTGQAYGAVNGTGAAITTNCSNIEAAARFLDYAFSDAGHMLYNFGREGVSYEMKDGVPTYTDIVTDQEKNGGLSVSQAMSKYIRACYNGPFEQDGDYLFQMYPLQVQKDAVGVWADTDASLHKMPLTYMTQEENDEYSEIMADIDTFREEQLAKFVAGQQSLDKLDEYYATMKTMGIERAIEIQQAAYDRYLDKLK